MAVTDSLTDTQDLAAKAAIIATVQNRTATTLSCAQRKVKTLFQLLTNEAELDAYVRETTRTESKPIAGITQVLRRIEDSPFYSPSSHSLAPYGYFCSRPIIGDCSPIAGGIYLSAKPREAVVVDGKYPALSAVQTDFRGRLSEVMARETCDDLTLFKFTAEYVRALLKLDARAVAKLNNTGPSGEDCKVALDSYINARCGEPRHMVLLAGFLLESLTRAGESKGRVSVDTSHSNERLCYTAASGELFVIDFTQNKTETH